ncbi:MAG: CopG family transcriptional regulator [Candidatus Bathyarchaeia archaeon]|nr:CopG family transcriptional regulator [Candidatus Bathyarchaeota archaeon]
MGDVNGQMRKALVALPDKVWEILDGELRGKMGESYSEIIRSIVIAYLSEKGYMERGRL